MTHTLPPKKPKQLRQALRGRLMCRIPHEGSPHAATITFAELVQHQAVVLRTNYMYPTEAW